jgi:osmotically-inducible protein OsmY
MRKENKNDHEITRQVREELLADESLSTYAHYVKIVITDGTITLNDVRNRLTMTSNQG